MRKSTTVLWIALLGGMMTAAPAAVSASPADSVKTVAKDSAGAAVAKDTLKARADSLISKAKLDSARALAATDSLGADSVSTDSSKARAKKRKRIVRETTVNTIDELKGQYRSPKKALFMSLVVPGLGQAYVGQNWFNYTRAAAYLITDVALAIGWHHYVVDKQNAEITKYKAFADSNWSMRRYEDSIAGYPDQGKFDTRYPHRQNYCESVQDQSSSAGKSLYQSCLDPLGTDQSFRSQYDDRNLSPDSIHNIRAAFPNSQNFYEVIGKETEFIEGWRDANNVVVGDSAFYQGDGNGSIAKDAAGNLIIATTAMQQRYIDMRAQANDYARMQAYFLGGMVVNHIVSALDAAITAHYHNKSLYQTETNWWDRVHLDSFLAWDNYAPVTSVQASVTF